MNRRELEQYIGRVYGVQPDYPWARTPENGVFRHGNNRKWFALVMRLSPEKLGLPEGGALDVVNFKCDPAMLGSLRQEPGFFPAYHMNKEQWITAALDGSAADDALKLALDISFEMTGVKAPKRRTASVEETEKQEA